MSRRKRSLNITLNPDQRQASEEIWASIEQRRWHLLTGDAGSGKTTVLQDLAEKAIARRKSIVLTAPTHQAVSVLSEKLKAAGIEVRCVTLQSLLKLRPKPNGDKLVFERSRDAEPVEEEIVAIDETSMVGTDLMQHCRLWLQGRAVIFCGDEGQLNPVGEERSETFDIPVRSHLTTNERQTKGNPILEAALLVKRSQGGPMDWSWCRPVHADRAGIYLPSVDATDEWLRRGFTSPDFQADTKRHRFVTWTNERVGQVNAKVRRWLYGEHIPTPFMPEERALIRDAFVRDKTVILNACQEVTVLEMKAGERTVDFEKRYSSEAWDVTLPVWETRLRDDEGMTWDVHLPRDDVPFKRVQARLAQEAQRVGARWEDYHSFKQSFVNARPIYAMTLHTAQGSTHRNTFLDVPEIVRWSRMHLLEAQHGLYVGMTRPSHTLTCIGVAA